MKVAIIYDRALALDRWFYTSYGNCITAKKTPLKC